MQTWACVLCGAAAAGKRLDAGRGAGPGADAAMKLEPRVLVVELARLAAALFDLSLSLSARLLLLDAFTSLLVLCSRSCTAQSVTDVDGGMSLGPCLAP